MKSSTANSDLFKDASVAEGREKTDRYASLLKNEVRGASTEEDVRLATYSFLKTLTQEMGVNVKIQNEHVVLTGGRIDSLFDNIIFEFKKPKYLSTPAGINEAVKGRDDKGGLAEYIIAIASRDSHNLEEFGNQLSTKIGVAFDGEHFIFVRFVANATMEIELEKIGRRFSEQRPAWFPQKIDGQFEVTEKKQIKNGLRYLLLYLRSISPRAPLTPLNVSARFGENSPHFRKHLRLLYQLLATKLNEKDPHTSTLYGEWDRVFGKVYGDLSSSYSDVGAKLSRHYGDDILINESIDLKYLIFSIHTYYNIILKLLVSNLFATLINPFLFRKAILTLSDEKFKSQVIGIMQGESFAILGVENFFETGFFDWWTYVWNENTSELLREVIVLLEELEVTTSITKPELIGDMVKQTYHGLMPRGLRHLLGEYFTPDWLAEYTTDLSGFTGTLGQTFLDSACGSGTFLIQAIKRKLLSNKDIDRKILIQDILKSIVGFDLNPISVIASKTNYLLALGDISDLDFVVKIPVYQTDSILTPTVHAKQKKEASAFTIQTVCGDFVVPALESREAIENILDVVGLAIKHQFTDKEFLEKSNQIRKDIDTDILLGIFHKVKKLTKLNQNGLWIPILKNSFAPVYSENQFDFVVGNPPWVSWRHMSKSYRELTLPIWLSYDIFDKSAYDMITTHDDFAMAFTYVSADHYLRLGGKLCFVIPQTFFKSKKGGEGFRKFHITRDDVSIPLSVEKVIDMVDVKPFAEVQNRTAVVLIEKGQATSYPVPYVIWTSSERLSEHDSLLAVKRKIYENTLQAIPITSFGENQSLNGPWLTLPEGEINKVQQIIGQSAYRGRKGVEPLGAKAVFVLKKPASHGSHKLRIVNDLSRGRLEEVTEIGERPGLVDDTFIFPMISGRNIRQFGLKDYAYLLMPHHKKKGVHNAIPEHELKVNYTLTYKWLSVFKDVLLETRERNSKFYDPEKDPFYFLDNVGEYTFAPWKVVWKEQNKRMTSCVISSKPDEPLSGKLIIPDSKVLFCPLENENEAHYLCAVLSSRVVTDIIEGYTIELQRGIDILQNIAIPKFEYTDATHKQLSELSQLAHELVAEDKDFLYVQAMIDELSLKIF